MKVLHCSGRQIEGHGINIAKYGPRAGGGRSFPAVAKKRKRRSDNLIPRPDAESHEREQQSVRTGGDADAGRRPAIARDPLPPERAHVRPE